MLSILPWVRWVSGSVMRLLFLKPVSELLVSTRLLYSTHALAKYLAAVSILTSSLRLDLEALAETSANLSFEPPTFELLFLALH